MNPEGEAVWKQTLTGEVGCIHQGANDENPERTVGPAVCTYCSLTVEVASLSKSQGPGQKEGAGRSRWGSGQGSRPRACGGRCVFETVEDGSLELTGRPRLERTI